VIDRVGSQVLACRQAKGNSNLHYILNSISLTGEQKDKKYHKPRCNSFSIVVSYRFCIRYP